VNADDGGFNASVSNEVTINVQHIDVYRVIVAGVGIVYYGEERPEAFRQFSLYVIRSPGVAVVLFKNYDVIKRHHFEAPIRLNKAPLYPNG